MHKRKIDWSHLVNDLVLNCETYHQEFYEAKKFACPGLHFHRRALDAEDEEKIEMVYAMLVSAGMHRYIDGPRMSEFPVFQKTMKKYITGLLSFSNLKLETITEIEINRLEGLFINLEAMRSVKKIVPLSKILAHYLPNLIGQIDNEYTFRFIFDAPRNPLSVKEFDLFKDIQLKLYKPVVSHDLFRTAAKKWLGKSIYPWDTSLPKIADNLIIGKIVMDKKHIE